MYLQQNAFPKPVSFIYCTILIVHLHVDLYFINDVFFMILVDDSIFITFLFLSIKKSVLFYNRCVYHANNLPNKTMQTLHALKHNRLYVQVHHLIFIIDILYTLFFNCFILLCSTIFKICWFIVCKSKTLQNSSKLANWPEPFFWKTRKKTIVFIMHYTNKSI